MANEKQDYKVADISLANWGRKEIVIAQSEMPALMKLREIYATEKPLEGAKILGCEKTLASHLGLENPNQGWC